MIAVAWALLLKALRWLLGSREGRIALLVIATVLLFRVHGDQRFRAGYSAAVAKQARATDRALVSAAFKSLDAYMAGAKAMAEIGSQREKGHAQALAAKDHVIAGLRAGTLQLHDYWQCLPDGAAAGSGAGRDGQAERRAEGAGDLVQVADDADIDLAACQATVTEYQRIGVLRVTP